MQVAEGFVESETSADLSPTLLTLGRDEEAEAEAMREPEEVERLWALAIIHHARGHRPKSDEALRELIDKTRMRALIRLPRRKRPARWTLHSSGSIARTLSGTAGSPG